MYDQHMICPGSLTNVTENGEVVGFSILARLPYYRGIGLSMVEDIAITVDGVAVPRANVRFAVRGLSWTLDEMETVYDQRWNFGEKALVSILQPGGLAPGKHQVQLAERIRISYLPFVPTTKTSQDMELAA